MIKSSLWRKHIRILVWFGWRQKPRKASPVCRNLLNCKIVSFQTTALQAGWLSPSLGSPTSSSWRAPAPVWHFSRGGAGRLQSRDVKIGGERREERAAGQGKGATENYHKTVSDPTNNWTNCTVVIFRIQSQVFNVTLFWAVAAQRDHRPPMDSLDEPGLPLAF